MAKRTLDDFDDAELGSLVRDRMRRLGKDAISRWNEDSKRLRMQRDAQMRGTGEARSIEPDPDDDDVAEREGIDEDLESGPREDPLRRADPGSAAHGGRPADPTVDHALAMDENQMRRCGFSEQAILQARARRSSTGASVAAMDHNIKGCGRLK